MRVLGRCIVANCTSVPEAYFWRTRPGYSSQVELELSELEWSPKCVSGCPGRGGGGSAQPEAHGAGHQVGFKLRGGIGGSRNVTVTGMSKSEDDHHDASVRDVTAVT
eukprot:1817916-Rhodomonas_salina.2